MKEVATELSSQPVLEIESMFELVRNHTTLTERTGSSNRMAELSSLLKG